MPRNHGLNINPSITSNMYESKKVCYLWNIWQTFFFMNNLGGPEVWCWISYLKVAGSNLAKIAIIHDIFL